MKSRKAIQRAGAVTGVVGMGLLVGALLITRLLPPWVPLSWRPRRLPR
jgi:hypothetical protein